MDFGEGIKAVRAESGLTQEQFAERLNVSRQTISSWENNRNLPDIGMVVEISKTFGTSLDKLILGGNGMADKLIKDGSDTRRAKFNAITAIVGAVLLCIGAACIIVKGMSVEYIDVQGFLHENFFLLPVGFFFIFAGLVGFLTAGIGTVVAKLKNRKKNV